ncbi:hypothetical protein HanRHA438_Chr03g0109641 [Helianthus annuus]|nr:hypothetical protein HanRHA438_Chr03g0109641 [Helianthus annuus]
MVGGRRRRMAKAWKALLLCGPIGAFESNHPCICKPNLSEKDINLRFMVCRLF